MILAAVLTLLFQATPLPADTPAPPPAQSAPAEPATMSPADASPPPDCIRRDDDCPFDTRKRPAESACVRAAKAGERCAQQTTGFKHYLALLHAGSVWGYTAGWYGRKTPRGRVYVENARRIFVELGHDPKAPGSISEVARTTLIKMYGTDNPTPSTPFLADRRRRATPR